MPVVDEIRLADPDAGWTLALDDATVAAHRIPRLVDIATRCTADPAKVVAFLPGGSATYRFNGTALGIRAVFEPRSAMELLVAVDGVEKRYGLVADAMQCRVVPDGGFMDLDPHVEHLVRITTDSALPDNRTAEGLPDPAVLSVLITRASDAVSSSPAPTPTPSPDTSAPQTTPHKDGVPLAAIVGTVVSVVVVALIGLFVWFLLRRRSRQRGQHIKAYGSPSMQHLGAAAPSIILEHSTIASSHSPSSWAPSATPFILPGARSSTSDTGGESSTRSSQSDGQAAAPNPPPISEKRARLAAKSQSHAAATAAADSVPVATAQRDRDGELRELTDAMNRAGMTVPMLFDRLRHPSAEDPSTSAARPDQLPRYE